MSRILLVTPVFHGYWRSISDALTRRGHEVVTHRYDGRGWQAKARHKLVHELPGVLGRGDGERAAREATEGALDALRGADPDVVVVVKGDVLGDDFWETLDDRRLPRVVWLYDELRRMQYAAATIARVGPVASYSALDVRALEDGVAAAYLPLAFDPHISTPDERTRNDEVVFVGARYPRREELMLALCDAGVPVRAFGRDWSHHPLDRFRTWGARPGVPSGRDLDRGESYAEMAAAAAALNVHGDQDGFTMRTFEACGVGGVQLIDRTDVDGLYEPGEDLLVFDDVDHLVDLARRVRTDTAWSDRIRLHGRARTLARHTFDHRTAVLETMWGTP